MYYYTKNTKVGIWVISYGSCICVLGISILHLFIRLIKLWNGSDRMGSCGRDRMVVGFTTTCAISAYYHYSCDSEPRSWRGVLDTTLCKKVSDFFGFLQQ